MKYEIEGGNDDGNEICWIGLGVGFKLFHINNIDYGKWRLNEKIR
jgi:hypothetical protein